MRNFWVPYDSEREWLAYDGTGLGQGGMVIVGGGCHGLGNGHSAGDVDPRNYNGDGKGIGYDVYAYAHEPRQCPKLEHRCYFVAR